MCLSTCNGGRMRYYRIHTSDCAYLTGQPRGIFTTVGKLVDAKVLTEEEENASNPLVKVRKLFGAGRDDDEEK